VFRVLDAVLVLKLQLLLKSVDFQLQKTDLVSLK
jgi:hypothetical protein